MRLRTSTMSFQRSSVRLEYFTAEAQNLIREPQNVIGQVQ